MISERTKVVVAACVAVALLGVALLHPPYREVDLPSGRRIRVTPLPAALVPVGTRATLLPYITTARDGEAVEREIRTDILPVLIAEAERAGETVILIQARRPLVDLGLFAALTHDWNLRFDRRDSGWESVPFAVPGR